MIENHSEDDHDRLYWDIPAPHLEAFRNLPSFPSLYVEISKRRIGIRNMRQSPDVELPKNNHPRPKTYLSGLYKYSVPRNRDLYSRRSSHQKSVTSWNWNADFSLSKPLIADKTAALSSRPGTPLWKPSVISKRRIPRRRIGISTPCLEKQRLVFMFIMKLTSDLARRKSSLLPFKQQGCAPLWHPTSLVS